MTHRPRPPELFRICDRFGTELSRKLFLAPPNEDTVITLDGHPLRIIELDLMANIIRVESAE